MAQHSLKKPVGKMILTGVISVGLYVLLLTNQGFINSTFGKGGLYAILPIATALVFSFIHGTFTGSFWSVLGVEASKKKGGK